LVARSAECDHPAGVETLPIVTAARIDSDALDSGQIDAAVRAAVLDGRPLYALDEDLIRRLRPDLVITQDLCHVCAVSSDEVGRVHSLDAEVLALDPRTLAEVAESVRVVARRLGVATRGGEVAAAMEARVAAVAGTVTGAPPVRVFVAEWLDPPFAAGHWVPEMVDIAGGDEVLGRPRERSFATTWDAVRAAAPQLIVLAPCGFDLERTVSEAGAVPAMGARVVAVDGDAAYSRPGPRVAEGVAQLAHLLHPDDVEAPALPSRELNPA
jgi:iron complex transport system substrate-binding protein